MSEEAKEALETIANPRRPGRRWLWRIGVGLGVSLLLLALAWLAWRPPPSPYDALVYQDVTLPQWFERYCRDVDDAVAEAALETFGFDLAPFLIERIQCRDSAWLLARDEGQKKLETLLPGLMKRFSQRLTADRVHYAAEKAFRLVVNRRGHPEIQSDGVVDALIAGLACEDPREIRGKYEKLASGKLAPLIIGGEVRKFSVKVLGLMREKAEAAVPALQAIARGGHEELARTAETALERITGEPLER